MTRQAQVGLFTLIGLAVLIVVFFTLSDFATRAEGYRIGVLFKTAAGLTPGSTVYMAGVPIGTIDRIDLQPDFTVDVIIAVKKQYDIPRDARFVITAPLTGTAQLLIEPARRRSGPIVIPAGIKIPPGVKLPPGYVLPGQAPPPNEPSPAPTPIALWPHEILPLSEQPRGETPVSLADLTEQGQATLNRLDALLSTFQANGPALFSQLQETVANVKRVAQNANGLTVRANGLLVGLNAKLDRIGASFETVGANLSVASGTLKGTASRSDAKVAALLDSLNRAAASLNTSLASLQGIASDPRLKANAVEATENLAQTTKTLALLANDLRQVTGDPQTQAQLRNTVATLDATAQRANSLLGQIGGTSSVYGVDTGASPYPAASTRPAPGATALPAPPPAPGSAPSGASPGPGAAPSAGAPGTKSSATAETAARFNLENALGRVAHNLFDLQARIAYIQPQNSQNPGLSPVLTSGHGAQFDLNLIVLPYNSFSFLTGANDIGGNYTINLAASKKLGPAQLGGGVLYSQLGFFGTLAGGPFTLDTRIYDPNWPTLDAYGRLRFMPHFELFAGERDLFHQSRRFTAGLQVNTGR